MASEQNDSDSIQTKTLKQQQLGSTGLLVTGLLEAFVCIIETLLVLGISTYFTRVITLVFDFNGALTREYPYVCILFDILGVIIPFVCIVEWLKRRYEYVFVNLSFSPFKSVSVSRLSMVLLSLGFLELLVILWYQHWADEWVFSLENYQAIDSCGGFKYSVFKGLYLVALGPLEEELLFRALIFFVILYRLCDNGKRNNDNKATKNAIIATSILFGLTHVYNLIPTNENQGIPRLYIFMQIVLGFLVGLVYQIIFLRNRSIWEVVLLHSVNNIFASFIPITLSLPFSHPIRLLSLFVPTLVYTLVLLKNWKYAFKNKKYQSKKLKKR
eukprot:TRINITY_DN4069_c0_g1_i1.p1 TRINITY_DN4069_c0_g1~~TRINITY_DN4069_c0_g1_i1.p1  ORF type:complete len:328 (-),score=41.10 TRINITY_DN4069_c0_g1_i1:34-1017(-)